MIFKIHKRNLVNRFLVSLLGAALMTAAPLLQAERSYVGTWGGIYPASSSGDNANCALCHNSYTSGSGFNPYGSAIESSSAGGISARIVDVEGLDSDSDPTASDNITEINANAQPGWTGTAPTGVIGDLDPAGNLPPVADANGPYFGTAEQQVQFDGSASSDPDGTITAWDWTFGDGNVGTGENPVHTYATDGTYDVSLVVTDDDSDSSVPSVTTASIEPAPQDPVADPGGPYNGVEGIAVVFDGSASFDPDGGNITQYFWDFGDGNTGFGEAPSHIYAADGSYPVTLTVVDDEGALSAPVSTTADIASDQDGDGTPDNLDNCILVANGPLIPDAGGNSQLDTDGDGYGNICDADLNQDLETDLSDFSLFRIAFSTTQDPDADFDGSGVVDLSDFSLFRVMFQSAPGPSGLTP
jgi:PKD repeat protein